MLACSHRPLAGCRNWDEQLSNRVGGLSRWAECGPRPAVRCRNIKDPIGRHLTGSPKEEALLSLLAMKIELHFSCVKVSMWCLCLAQHNRPFVKPPPPWLQLLSKLFLVGSFPEACNSPQFQSKIFSEGNFD